MSRVVHFEIGVDDPERGIKFYKEVFDWKIEKWDGPVDYWLIQTGEEGEPGINGALQKRQDKEGTTNTIDVENLDEMIAKVEKGGGKVVVPKMTVPQVGTMVYCTDPDGNVFGMMQADPNM